MICTLLNQIGYISAAVYAGDVRDGQAVLGSTVPEMADQSAQVPFRAD